MKRRRQKHKEFYSYHRKTSETEIVSAANKIKTLSAKRSSGGACMSRRVGESTKRAERDPFL
jgi:hypothetical protein